MIYKVKEKPLKVLGVLLCYNDADILEDVIKYLISNKHNIIVWDHGSDDGTREILDKYDNILVERKYVPRTFDFYKLYQEMSQNLIDNYIDKYQWISWPDQDEILEGPDRRKSYYDYICEVYKSEYDWVKFNNFNYWFTSEDNISEVSPIKRIKRYCLFPDCAPRIRSWRAKVTNIREFNHNTLPGKMYPLFFNLRHYPMRTINQAKRRLNKDRAFIQRGNANYHYNNMKRNFKKVFIKPRNLFYDNGNELKKEVIFNWRDIYGYS